MTFRLAVFCWAACGLAAYGQERQPVVRDLLAQIQRDAVTANFSPVAHWGSNPNRYSQWTSHSNRLIPVYTFGAAGKGGGMSLADYAGANSPYRSAEKLAKIYGAEPRGSVNPNADYFDQTNIFDLQKAALVAGKKRIVLMVFDGMGWEATRAAAIHKSGKRYDAGRGSGLLFQDYTGAGPSEFGLMCTSPHSGDKSKIDVDLQTAAKNPCTGGFDSVRGGAAPWIKGSEPEYIKGPDHCRGAHTYTDSSASATSMCAGIKTYNYAINVLPDGKQVDTIAHLAQRAGYKVGAVTSVPISHATPASAYSHNVTRKDYQDLTRDMLGLKSIAHPSEPLPGMDVVIGAGWGVSEFTAKELADERKSQGENFVLGNRYLTAADRQALDASHGGKYVVAERTAGQAGRDVLVAAGKRAAAENRRLFGFFGVRGLGEGHLPFATANGDFQPAPDREKRIEKYTPADIHENPILADIAETALDYLAAGDGKFWLMVEAGDVDWAMHANNLDNMVGAVYSGDRAFAAIVGWIEKHGGWNDTVMIVTSDHDHYLVLEQPDALLPKKWR